MTSPRDYFDSAALPPLRDVIKQHSLSARHALGQHFLLDINLLRRIADEAGDLSGCTVLEIGPGPGGLTRALLERAARVIAIEQDRRCIEALGLLAEYSEGALEIVEGDALKMPPAELLREGEKCVIVSNLPYNAGTQMLVNWLGDLQGIGRMTLMFQKEVAARLVAQPNSRDYGRLSVFGQWLCETRRLFDIPAAAFVPPPKVTSTVISLTPREAPLFQANAETLERVTRAAFGQRRKMLRSSLKTLGTDTGNVLSAAGVDPTARAETLSIEDFCAIARVIDAPRKDRLSNLPEAVLRIPSARPAGAGAAVRKPVLPRPGQRFHRYRD